MMDQKEQFYELLENHVSSLDKKKKDKFIITQEVYKKILECLQLKKGSPCAGEVQILVPQTLQDRDHWKQQSSCPLTTKEDIYDTIKKCHQRVGHSRRNKTLGHARTMHGLSEKLWVLPSNLSRLQCLGASEKGKGYQTYHLPWLFDEGAS